MTAYLLALSAYLTIAVAIISLWSWSNVDGAPSEWGLCLVTALLWPVWLVAVVL